MKFLHLSDLHIGRRLGGISLMEDQLDALNQALEMASGCDAVLLAGDLYDKAQPTAEAIRAASGFLVALSRLEKPVFAISGNHDALSRSPIATSCWGAAACSCPRLLTARPCAARFATNTAK